MNFERAAESARRELGVGLDGPIPDLLRHVEDEGGVHVFIVPLGIEGIDGAFQLVEGDAFILINQDCGPVRKRFTLAHEFGHFFLKHGAQLDRRISFRDQPIAEREANRFAASLLVPRPALDQWFARHGDPKVDLAVLVRIAFFFNVSAFVIRYRLEDTGKIGASAAKRFDEDILRQDHYRVASEIGLQRPRDSITSQHSRGAYVPAAMQARIADLLRRGLMSKEAAATLLRLEGAPAEEQLQEMAESHGREDEAGDGSTNSAAE